MGKKANDKVEVRIKDQERKIIEDAKKRTGLTDSAFIRLLIRLFGPKVGKEE